MNTYTHNVVATVSKYLLLSVVIMLCLHSGSVLADANVGIGKVAGTVTDTMSNLAKLITAVSFVMGFGFAAAAILKFKAHKDNPAQIPIGTPIALLFIGAALIYLPSLYQSVGQTLFGNEAKAGQAKGMEDPGGGSSGS